MYSSLYHVVHQTRDLVKSLWFRFANVSSESLASDARVRQVGLIYSVYRFIVSTFLLMTSYAIIKGKAQVVMAGLVESVVITSYLALSLFLLLLFYLVPTYARRQLMLGFVFDIILLTAYTIHGSISDLQIVLLYMIVVAASFMLLPLSRAACVVVASIIAIAYQQLSASFTDVEINMTFGDSLLLAICLVAVGFLSWSVSQRLTMAEESVSLHAKEVEKLNIINNIVVKNMVNGVLVVDENRNIVMINESAKHLLRLPNTANIEIYNNPAKMIDLARLIVREHPRLTHWYRTINPEMAVSWIYELRPDSNNPSDKLRLNNRPLAK